MLRGRSLELVILKGGERKEPLSPPIRVEVYRDGLLDVGVVQGDVTLSLDRPGVLEGILVQPVQRGVATFDPLSISEPGMYTLTATCENTDLLNSDSPVIVGGQLKIWGLYNLPFSPLPELRGQWLNFHGPGVPIGIWAKIIREGVHPILGRYIEVEQHTAATSLDELLAFSGLITVRRNSINPFMQPPDWYLVGADSWFLWDPDGGESLFSSFDDPATDTLEITDRIEILRNVVINITSSPTEARAGTNQGVMGVIQNQDGTVAIDLNGNVELEIRLGIAPVYLKTVPVVNGHFFTVIPMPDDPEYYTIWVSYRGDWYAANQVSARRNVVVTEPAPPPGPDPDPPGSFPPKEYGLEAGGCKLTFSTNCVLELEASDPCIEVLVK